MTKLGLYKHYKTGNLYRVTDMAINCTNAQNDQVMVVYLTADIEAKFVRAEAEFNELIDGVPRFSWISY
jgi:hypothetical protein